MNVMNGGSVMAPAVPPPGTFPPGTQIQLGQYVVILERYIAEGGFAHVYLASLLGGPPSTVVVKRIAVADKERLAIVNNEIETMKRLGQHKNIVEYMDSTMGKLEGGGYEVLILMENCAGGPVIDIMNRRLQHRLTEPEILKIFSNVCEAVAYMHYHDPPVLHRDIKVENILLSNNQYKLCDFGSATTNILRGDNIPKTVKEIQLLEEDINNHTTLQYRAPEMLDLYMRKGIDEKIDIWALGVLLYKLCYYTTPFEEQGQLAILNARYTIPDQPIFSNELKGLIRSMLKEEPSQRPNIYQVLEMTSIIRGLPCPIQNKYPEASFSANNQAAPSAATSMDIFTTAPMSRPMDVLPSIAPMRRGRPTRSPALESMPNEPAINTKNENALGDGFGAFSSTTDFQAGFDDSFGTFPSAAGANSTSSGDGFDFGGSSNSTNGANSTSAKFSLGFEEPKTSVGDFGFKSTIASTSSTTSSAPSNNVTSSPGTSKGPRPLSAMATPSTTSKPTAMDLLLSDSTPSGTVYSNKSNSSLTSTAPVQSPSAQLTGPSLQARLRNLGLGGGDVATSSSRAGSGSSAYPNISPAQGAAHPAPLRPANASHRSNNSISSNSSGSNSTSSAVKAAASKYPPLTGSKHDHMELLQQQQLEQLGQFSTELSRAPDNRGKAKVLDPSKTLDGLRQQNSNSGASYQQASASSHNTPAMMSPDVSGLGLGHSSLVPHGSRPNNSRSLSPLPMSSQGASMEVPGTKTPTIPLRTTSSEMALPAPPPKPSHSHNHSQSGLTATSLRPTAAPKPSEPAKPGHSNSDDDEIQQIRSQFERQRRELVEQQQRQMEEQQREHRVQQQRLQDQQLRELQSQQERWIAKRRAQKEQERQAQSPQQRQDSQLPPQLSGRSATSVNTSSSLVNHYGSSPSSSSSVLSSSTASSMMLHSQQSPSVSATLSPSASVSSLASTMTSATATMASTASSRKPWAGGSGTTVNGETGYVPRTTYTPASSNTNTTTLAPNAPPRSSERPRAVTTESSGLTGSSMAKPARSRGLSSSNNASSLPQGKKPELMPKPTRFRMKDGAGNLAVGEEEAFKRRFPSADDFDQDDLLEASIVSGSSSPRSRSIASPPSSARPSLDYIRREEEEEEEEEILSRPPRRGRGVLKEYGRVSSPASGVSSSLSGPRNQSLQSALEDAEMEDKPIESVRERVQRMNRGGMAE
ncbi:hypothetical protein DFQ26_009432 [Actinomortierella ambigua]|nr:hypothetical protein DFQ26_009432 [Actinomortierella ambigua]